MKLRGYPPQGIPVYSYVGKPEGSIIGGLPGPKGNPGNQGIQGEDGEQGEQGDMGPQGPPGVGITGEVATYAALPPTPAEEDSYVVTADGLLYRYHSGAWPAEGEGYPFRGPRGLTGDQGIQGLKGDKGDKGDTGDQGIQGIEGEQGIQGIKGDTGDQGTAGVSFDLEGHVATYADLAGLTPTDGQAWVVDASGLLYYYDGAAFPAEGAGVPFQGPQGIKGDTGNQGVKGDTGLQGVKGDTGLKGDTGTTAWADLTGKPAVIAAGADAATARSAIGAGTSSLSVGTASGTACEGNDGRLSNTRTPSDGSVTTAKIADANVTAAKLSGSGDGVLAIISGAFFRAAAPLGNLVGEDQPQPLTLKRIKPRVISTTTTTAPTIATDTYDQLNITALANNITSMTTNLTGTPYPGQKFIIRIKDNGTARSIVWGASWRGIGVTLPTTTVVSKTLYIGSIWNDADSIWDVVAVSQQA